MKKKIFAIFLASLMLCSCFAGCNGGSNNTGSGDNSSNASSDVNNDTTSSDSGNTGDVNKPTINVSDNEEHLVDESKRTHINNNDYSKMKPFVVEGASEYVIIDGANTAQSKEARDYMRNQIYACTGYKPEVILDTDHDFLNDDTTLQNRAFNYSPSSKYIVYSHEPLEKLANVQWRTDIDLDYSGYMIKTVGDSVFFKVNSLYGYQTSMLAFLRDYNDSQSVIDIFERLYLELRPDHFMEIFKVCLADNGSEFSNPKAIEFDRQDNLRTRIFYCDPSAPYQKGSAERNHEFIRMFLPKGYDFSHFTQEDISLMMDHINSYSRESLGNKSPYDMFAFLYGQKILDLLGCHRIPPQDVTLSRSIFRKEVLS